MKMNCQCYIESGIRLDSRKRVLAELPRLIDKLVGRKNFDAIAVLGTSGLLIGPSLADKMGKELLVVRKQNDGAHSSRQVEGGNVGVGFRYIVVDDLVASGKTIQNAVKAVDAMTGMKDDFTPLPFLPVLVGVFCYNQQEWDTQKVMFEGRAPVMVNGFYLRGKEVVYTPETKARLENALTVAAETPTLAP